MRILLVDDERLILETLGEFLQRLGHEVITEVEAGAAFERAEEANGRIDLLVSDICLPGEDGASLLTRFRRTYPETDVILITGYPGRVEATDAVELGACAFLRKPIKLSELEVLVEQIRRQRASRTQVHRLDASLKTERRQNEEAVRDRMFARRLARRIFPREFSWFPRTRIHVRHLPLAAAGGDYIDLRPYGPHRALIMVADVSGHGTPAAFGGIALKTWFTSLEDRLGPAEVLASADRMMTEVFPEEFYATAFCAIYDDSDQSLRYSIAGHPRPMRLSASAGARLLDGDGAPLGIDPQPRQAYELHETRLAEDEVLLAFTDGLTDKPEKLGRTLEAALGQSAEVRREFGDLQLLVTRILDTAIRNEPLRAFSDDLSILAFGPAAPRPLVAPRSLAGCRVAVFDDDPEVRGLLVSLLEHEGMAVRAFGDATVVVDDIRACAPDVVLMDLHMPGVDGIDALRQLRRAFPDLPVTLVSGENIDQAARAALAERAAGFVRKPIDLDELLDALRKALDFRPGRDAIVVDHLDGDWMDFVISSSETSLDLLTRYLESLGRQPVPPEALGDVIYCVREIAGNAIEWGNLRNPDLKVRVSTVILPDRVMIKIADEGSGFDARGFLETTDPGDRLEARERTGKRIGGFGLDIVRARMDQVAFNGKGNVVTMTKFFQN